MVRRNLMNIIDSFVYDEAKAERLELSMRKKIMKERQRQKMTPQELAERSNVSLSYVYGIESGKVKILNTSLKSFVRIVYALGIPFSEIMPFEEEKAVTYGDQFDEITSDLPDKKIEFLLDIAKQYSNLEE